MPNYAELDHCPVTGLDLSELEDRGYTTDRSNTKSDTKDTKSDKSSTKDAK